MKTNFSLGSLLKRFGTDAPKDIALRQKILLATIGGIILVVFVFVTGVFDAPQKDSKTSQEKLEKPQVVTFEGAGSRAPREEVWARRLENEASSMREDKKALEGKLNLMSKEMDVLKGLLQKGMGEEMDTPLPPHDENTPVPLPTMPDVDARSEIPMSAPMDFPLHQPEEVPMASHGGAQMGTSLPEGYKNIAVIKRTKGPTDPQIVEGGMPAGTRVKGVSATGLAIGTGTNAQSDPHPILIRLREDFLMPRGFSAPLKDAVIIGKCHGDRSSERAFCVLETIAFVEASGEIIEEKIQGWIFGEDGRYGLRGQVVDRTDDLLRNSFLSGAVSSMANFFQSTTSSSVFPVSPFGQTNAMNPSDMLKAGGAKGVGDALDRLAKYYIDTAEKMSPTLLINPGREVDIVLKSKFDFNKSVYRRARVRAAQGPRHQFAMDHAGKMSKTLEVRRDLE